MDKMHIRSNIALYKLFILFNEPLFRGPIIIASLQKLAHLSLPDIYFIESAIMVLCVALDIPCGVLADLIGKKKVLILGRIFFILGLITFACMTGLYTAWLSNILWSIGYSLQSGADVSFLYSNLKSKGLEAKFKKIEGCAVGAQLLLLACCALATGPLASINMRIPLFLAIPFAGIPLVTAFFFKEPVSTKGYSARNQIETLKKGVCIVMQKPEVRWIIGFCTLVTGASKIWMFTYNPYFEQVGIDLKYYGFIIFLVNIVAWISSHYVCRIEEYLRERGCIILMILCIGVPICIMGLVPWWPMAYLIACQGFIRGFIRPFRGDFINKHIASNDIRTTVMSVQSTASNIVSIMALLWFGLMTKHLSLLNSLTILGLVVLILGILSYRSYSKLAS